MRLEVLCVGGVRGPLETAVREYEERAGRYWKLRITEVESGGGRGKDPGGAGVRKAEEARLLARLPGEGGVVVALTREGRARSSREFAGLLADWGLRSVQNVTFILGGAFGLGEGVLQRATLKLSLSAMTFPHELARLLLMEQLYRAGTILRHEPYHKGP